MPSLKIMTWNTQGDQDDQLLANLILSNDLDILALQEFPRGKDLTELFNLINADNPIPYELQYIDHALPDPNFEKISFKRKTATPVPTEDNAYYIIHKSNLVVSNPGLMGVIPNYMNIDYIQNWLNTSTIKNIDSHLERLAMRRPYYVQFTYGGHKIHLLTWHAPNGGGKRVAGLAFDLLLKTQFEFAKLDLNQDWRFPPEESIIIAGDLNITGAELTASLGGMSKIWNRTKNSEASDVDHILAYNSDDVKKEKAYIKDGRKRSELNGYLTSDHPIVLAKVELPLLSTPPPPKLKGKRAAAIGKGKGKAAKAGTN